MRALEGGVGGQGVPGAGFDRVTVGGDLDFIGAGEDLDPHGPADRSALEDRADGEREPVGPEAALSPGGGAAWGQGLAPGFA